MRELALSKTEQSLFSWTTHNLLTPEFVIKFTDIILPNFDIVTNVTKVGYMYYGLPGDSPVRLCLFTSNDPEDGPPEFMREAGFAELLLKVDGHNIFRGALGPGDETALWFKGHDGESCRVEPETGVRAVLPYVLPYRFFRSSQDPDGFEIKDAKGLEGHQIHAKVIRSFDLHLNLKEIGETSPAERLPFIPQSAIASIQAG